MLLSDSSSRLLLDLALSTTSGLVEIELTGIMLYPRELSPLIPEDSDPAVACKRRLRRFCVVSTNYTNIKCSTRYVSGLYRLVSKHLPYLYDVGIWGALNHLENRVRVDSYLLRTRDVVVV